MMFEIPFYDAITISPASLLAFFLILWACFGLIFGILSAPYKNARLTPWWVYLASPFLALLITGIIISVTFYIFLAVSLEQYSF